MISSGYGLSLDVISTNSGRLRRTEMKEQFETRRIAVLLGPKSLLGLLKLILKVVKQSFHAVDLIQSDSVEDNEGQEV